MAGAEASVTLTGQVGVLTKDWEKEIVYALHDAAPDLLDIELYNVGSRTPVDTGALLSSEKGQAYTGSNNPDLVYLYADDTEQLDEWGRVYAPYQEGGVLGLATYTNDPHEMFAKALTDDIPAIEQWGTQAVQAGCDAIVNG